jgi:glycoside/pentoside/hexuronide:cation symporter, GPH family
MQEFSSVGRASVSKTEGRGFESLNSCHFYLESYRKATEGGMNQPLSRRTVTAFATGIGPVAVLGLPFSVYLPPFVAAGGVVPVALVGLIFSLSTLWDGIVDPLIGTMIDRKSKGDAPHRRWMQIAALPLALLLPLLVIWGDDLNFWLLLPLLLLFYSSLSLFDVAHLSWGSALASNADDSARLFGNREFAGKIILVLAFALPAIAQALIPDLDLQGRILAYASLTLVVLPLALFAIAQLPGRAVVPEHGIGWRQEIKASLSSATLLQILLVQFLGAFSFGALSATFIFFADGYLRLDARGALLLFGTFVGGAMLTPLWIILARRFGKPQTMIANCLWLLVAMLSGLALPQGGFTVAMLFSIALGSGFMGLIFLHGMISDFAPHDRTRCGRDRTGFLFAMLNLTQKFGNAVAVAVAYALLGAYGFDASKPGESGELIRNLFIGLPVLGWSMMIFVLLFLRRHASVNQRLAKG